MKSKILSLIMLAAFALSACQSPDELKPATSREGINSLTAKFPDDTRDENSFSSEIDHNSGTITIVFPYNYPANSNNVVTSDMLKNMRVAASLDDNVTVEPPLLYLDLSKENHITVTDQLKNKKQYKIVAEIRKSSECAITAYELPSLALAGIIDETNKVISIISVDNLGSVLADFKISHGATIAPDPSVTAQNYDSQFTLTVTAQNGTNQAVYTVKKAVPEKLTFGMRTGSAKVLWQKKMAADIGITTVNLTGGMAVTKDYVVLNTRNEDMVYIDRKTGANVGTVSLSNKGSLTNFYCTADDGDNILVCNLAPNDGNFKVWRINGVSGTQQAYIEWAGGVAIGRKLSIKGSLDGDAIITAPILAAGGQFARWIVTGGALVSQTPDIVTVGGTIAWTTNCDIVYGSATNTSADYFISSYGAPYKFSWIDGMTNTVKVQTPSAISSNWIQNAVDHTTFNGCPYVVSNSVNSFTWGSDDKIYLYDVSTNAGLNGTVWSCDIGLYGSMSAAGIANGNGTSDVALKVSDNGYYMYLYFMFTNGYVVCVQYDCIDM